MKAVTLRNIPPQVKKAIERRAREKKTSVNKAVIEMLEECAGGPAKHDEVYHDLDRLAGTWSSEEARAFEQALNQQREIDAELWK